MTLDALLLSVRVWECLLISESELWASSFVPLAHLAAMKRAMRRHRRGLRLLIDTHAIAQCPAVL